MITALYLYSLSATKRLRKGLVAYLSMKRYSQNHVIIDRHLKDSGSCGN